VAKNFQDARAPLPWDVDMADQLEICFPHLCYHAIFGHSRSNHTSVIWRSVRKFWPLTPRLSWSLKVIGSIATY